MARYLRQSPVSRSRHRRLKLFAGLLLALLFAALALLKPLIPPLGSRPSPFGVVAHVIDGDTVVLEDSRRVRYIGIDTPEMDAPRDDTRALARRAADSNSSLVLKREVTLEFDVETKDKYGRTLAYVWVDGRMANAELIKAGLARAVIYGGNSKHAPEFSSLEQQARADRLGIWADTP